MRPRTHDRYSSSTLISGKGGAGPSLMRTTLEEPSLRPYHIRDQEPMTITPQALIGGKGGSKFKVALRLRDQESRRMQDGCKVYMDSYMASNGSCVHGTWTIFKIHLLEVGLTQNHWETMLHNQLIFLFDHV